MNEKMEMVVVEMIIGQVIGIKIGILEDYYRDSVIDNMERIFGMLG